jgi:hypothetical protein
LAIAFALLGMYGVLLGQSVAIATFVRAALLAYFLAQGTIVAIWLGLISPFLYWLLFVALGTPLFIMAVLRLPHHPENFAILAILPVLYPLPFAVGAAFGLVVRWLISPGETELRGEPIRFSMYRLFQWTFGIALALGLVRLVPNAMNVNALVYFLFVSGVVCGFASVLTLLRPVARQHALAVPLGIAGLCVLLAAVLLQLSPLEMAAGLVGGILHVFALSLFLTIYRRAGYRAVWRRGYYPELVRKIEREPVNPLAD